MIIIIKVLVLCVTAVVPVSAIAEEDVNQMREGVWMKLGQICQAKYGEFNEAKFRDKFSQAFAEGLSGAVNSEQEIVEELAESPVIGGKTLYFPAISGPHTVENVTSNMDRHTKAIEMVLALNVNGIGVTFFGGKDFCLVLHFSIAKSTISPNVTKILAKKFNLECICPKTQAVADEYATKFSRNVCGDNDPKVYPLDCGYELLWNVVTSQLPEVAIKSIQSDSEVIKQVRKVRDNIASIAVSCIEEIELHDRIVRPTTKYRVVVLYFLQRGIGLSKPSKDALWVALPKIHSSLKKLNGVALKMAELKAFSLKTVPDAPYIEDVCGAITVVQPLLAEKSISEMQIFDNELLESLKKRLQIMSKFEGIGYCWRVIGAPEDISKCVGCLVVVIRCLENDLLKSFPILASLNFNPEAMARVNLAVSGRAPMQVERIMKEERTLEQLSNYILKKKKEGHFMGLVITRKVDCKQPENTSAVYITSVICCNLPNADEEKWNQKVRTQAVAESTLWIQQKGLKTSDHLATPMPQAHSRTDKMPSPDQQQASSAPKLLQKRISSNSTPKSIPIATPEQQTSATTPVDNGDAKFIFDTAHVPLTNLKSTNINQIPTSELTPANPQNLNEVVPDIVIPAPKVASEPDKENPSPNLEVKATTDFGQHTDVEPAKQNDTKQQQPINSIPHKPIVPESGSIPNVELFSSGVTDLSSAPQPSTTTLNSPYALNDKKQDPKERKTISSPENLNQLKQIPNFEQDKTQNLSSSMVNLVNTQRSMSGDSDDTTINSNTMPTHVAQPVATPVQPIQIDKTVTSGNPSLPNDTIDKSIPEDKPAKLNQTPILELNQTQPNWTEIKPTTVIKVPKSHEPETKQAINVKDGKDKEARRTNNVKNTQQSSKESNDGITVKPILQEDGGVPSVGVSSAIATNLTSAVQPSNTALNTLPALTNQMLDPKQPDNSKLKPIASPEDGTKPSGLLRNLVDEGVQGTLTNPPVQNSAVPLPAETNQALIPVATGNLQLDKINTTPTKLIATTPLNQNPTAQQINTVSQGLPISDSKNTTNDSGKLPDSTNTAGENPQTNVRIPLKKVDDSISTEIATKTDVGAQSTSSTKPADYLQPKTTAKKFVPRSPPKGLTMTKELSEKFNQMKNPTNKIDSTKHSNAADITRPVVNGNKTKSNGPQLTTHEDNSKCRSPPASITEIRNSEAVSSKNYRNDLVDRRINGVPTNFESVLVTSALCRLPVSEAIGCWDTFKDTALKLLEKSRKLGETLTPGIRSQALAINEKEREMYLEDPEKDESICVICAPGLAPNCSFNNAMNKFRTSNNPDLLEKFLKWPNKIEVGMILEKYETKGVSTEGTYYKLWIVYEKIN